MQKNLLAVTEVGTGGDIPPLRGIGPLGLEKLTGQDAPGLFNKFISSAIGIMTVVAILWFVFILLGGAYGIISSGGDKQALENAKKRIVNGLIGLIVVIVAVFLIDLIGGIIGIREILNPAYFIERLSP